ncbi:predicted transcriptional regulator [Weissella oryzae SG25]|uniref:Predicted transcriptional regulator n=1 Tax=Weissella oryzae (strain DSM 25784 / JCM 18191 / LMG 30913 / SG25) TaxID=1329250 RepID=A0A069D2I7_WEIOS|nr:MarR family transcriptional regulator [Weissella oryzae]GAK31641.1 predicted transcriptional regulator [Weissella oryzae SG25]
MEYQELAERFFACVKNKQTKGVMMRLSEYAHGEQMILTYLYKHANEAVVPSDLAAHARLSSARIATVLNGLEERNMIKREISKTDRRKILVTLTPLGQVEVKKAIEVALSRAAHIFEQMGPEKAAAFVEGLELFLKLGIEVEEGKEEV